VTGLRSRLWGNCFIRCKTGSYLSEESTFFRASDRNNVQQKLSVFPKQYLARAASLRTLCSQLTAIEADVWEQVTRKGVRKDFHDYTSFHTPHHVFCHAASRCFLLCHLTTATGSNLHPSLQNSDARSYAANSEFGTRASGFVSLSQFNCFLFCYKC
jgi:hypothetical protein